MWIKLKYLKFHIKKKKNIRAFCILKNIKKKTVFDDNRLCPIKKKKAIHASNK